MSSLLSHTELNNESLIVSRPQPSTALNNDHLTNHARSRLVSPTTGNIQTLSSCQPLPSIEVNSHPLSNRHSPPSVTVNSQHLTKSRPKPAISENNQSRINGQHLPPIAVNNKPLTNSRRIINRVNLDVHQETEELTIQNTKQLNNKHTGYQKASFAPAVRFVYGEAVEKALRRNGCLMNGFKSARAYADNVSEAYITRFPEILLDSVETTDRLRCSKRHLFASTPYRRPSMASKQSSKSPQGFHKQRLSLPPLVRRGSSLISIKSSLSRYASTGQLGYSVKHTLR